MDHDSGSDSPLLTARLDPQDAYLDREPYLDRDAYLDVVDLPPSSSSSTAGVNDEHDNLLVLDCSRAREPIEGGGPLNRSDDSAGSNTIRDVGTSDISRLADNGARYLDESEIKPLPVPPSCSFLANLLNRLSGPAEDWMTQFRALDDLRAVVKYHPTVLCTTLPQRKPSPKKQAPLSSQIIPILGGLMDSLRSNVQKNSIITFVDLIAAIGHTIVDIQLIQLALTICLKRAAAPSASGGFLVEEADRALRQVVMSCSPTRLALAFSRLTPDQKLSQKMKSKLSVCLGVLFSRSTFAQISPQNIKLFVSALQKWTVEANEETRRTSKAALLMLLRVFNQDLMKSSSPELSCSELASLSSRSRSWGDQVDVLEVLGVPLPECPEGPSLIRCGSDPKGFERPPPPVRSFTPVQQRVRDSTRSVSAAPRLLDLGKAARFGGSAAVASSTRAPRRIPATSARAPMVRPPAKTAEAIVPNRRPSLSISGSFASPKSRLPSSPAWSPGGPPDVPLANWLLHGDDVEEDDDSWAWDNERDSTDNTRRTLGRVGSISGTFGTIIMGPKRATTPVKDR